MPNLEPTGVPFAEAIAFLRGRLKLSESDWLSVLRGAQAAAETAVDAQAEAMGRDFLAAITEIVAQGGTSQDFRKQYDAVTARYGWASAGDPGWHAELIWRMQVFRRAAGRWEQMQRLAAARPDLRYFFRYVTAGDHRVRPAHQEWDGIILPIDHPFWLTHWPPNGFNCRCDVQLVSERELVRYGWSVTAENDPRLALPPDPGFAGNAGVAWAALRDGGPAAETASVLGIGELVARAELLPDGAKAPIAALSLEVQRYLGAEAPTVFVSATTVRTHRYHREADASAYGQVVAQLVNQGSVIADPGGRNVVRVVGLVGGQYWAAVIKVDRQGQLWLSSLHRSNQRQWRRYRQAKTIWEGEK